MVGSSHSTERSKVHSKVRVATVSDVSGTVSNTGGSASVGYERTMNGLF